VSDKNYFPSDTSTRLLTRNNSFSEYHQTFQPQKTFPIDLKTIIKNIEKKLCNPRVEKYIFPVWK